MSITNSTIITLVYRPADEIAPTWEVSFEDLENIHWTRTILPASGRSFPNPQLVATAMVWIDDPANERVRRTGAFAAKRTLIIEKSRNENIWADLIKMFPKPDGFRNSRPLTDLMIAEGVKEMMEVICSRQEHPAIHRTKDGRFYIKTRELKVTQFDDPSEGTLAERNKRVTQAMQIALEEHGGFEVSKYRGSYVAYRYKN